MHSYNALTTDLAVHSQLEISAPLRYKEYFGRLDSDNLKTCLGVH